MPESMDELVSRVAVELKRPVELDPGLDARVMAEVRMHSRRQTRPWLLRPRTFSLTPLGGLAMAATLAAVVAGTTLTIARTSSSPEATAAAGVVRFELHAPEAHSVVVVGDFNDWDPAATPLEPAGSSGAWAVTLPLGPGRYRYGFVIDGTEWLADPGAPRAPDDDFGTPSSILTVGAL